MRCSVDQSLQRAIPLNRIDAYPAFLSRDDLRRPLDDVALRSLERFDSPRRAALVEAVVPSLERWSAPPEAIDAAHRLGEVGVGAVVTGQQAGIATGPLYTVYKAIGALRAARELERIHPGRAFVPVFWIEADDHDFAEVRSITVAGRNGFPERVSYDDGNDEPLHVGDRTIDRTAFDRFVEKLESVLQPSDFTSDAMSLLRDCYRSGDESLADGFARCLYALLGDVPLVVVSSRNPSLKRLAADVFSTEAADPVPMFRAIQRRTAELTAEGRPAPITPRPGALFVTVDGLRRSLDDDGDGYAIRGTDRRMSRAQAAELAAKEPERMSPGVALRPVVQDAILPTVLYLGGPSEVAYLEQLRDAYSGFSIEPPAVRARPFVLMVEPTVLRASDRPDVTLETFLTPDFDPAAIVISEELKGRVEAAALRTVREVEGAMETMRPLVDEIDPTLDKALSAAATRAVKEVENVAGRLRSALKKREKTSIDRLARAHALVMPDDELQERVINPLYYVNKYGLVEFRRVLGEVTLEDGSMQVIGIGGA